MGRNLIVARVGEKSLHRNWLRGDKPNFDLVLLFYGKEVPKNWAEDGLETHVIPGSKWEGISFYMENNRAWRDYDRVCFPDDDLLFDATLLNKFLYFAEKLQLDLCQPALDFDSYFSHAITLQSPSFLVRFTNFVEIMFPCLSQRFLEISKELFAASHSGWGMDNYWAILLEKHNMSLPGIIDYTTITHTRPISLSGGSHRGPGYSPHDDLTMFCKKYNFKVKTPRVVGGILHSDKGPNDAKLLAIDSDPTELAISLIQDIFAQKNMQIDKKFNYITQTVASTYESLREPNNII